MRSQPTGNSSQQKIHLWMNVVFFGLIISSAALLDLSGAISVRHECSDYGAQISMQFLSESASK